MYNDFLCNSSLVILVSFLTAATRVFAYLLRREISISNLNNIQIFVEFNCPELNYLVYKSVFFYCCRLIPFKILILQTHYFYGMYVSILCSPKSTLTHTDIFGSNL